MSWTRPPAGCWPTSADRCCDIWTHEDSGLWELSQYHHYTISKIGCWVALDPAATLGRGRAAAGAHAARWRQEAAGITRWVQAHTEVLDAAPAGARTGFDRGQ